MPACCGQKLTVKSDIGLMHCCILFTGAWVSQGDGGVDSSGWLQGSEEAEEDQEGPQAPLLG